MQVHITKSFEIINSYLPYNYVKLTSQNLIKKDIQVTPGTIRNTRIGKVKRLDIIEALVEVALDNKNQIERIQKIIS